MEGRAPVAVMGEGTPVVNKSPELDPLNTSKLQNTRRQSQTPDPEMDSNDTKIKFDDSEAETEILSTTNTPAKSRKFGLDESLEAIEENGVLALGTDSISGLESALSPGVDATNSIRPRRKRKIATNEVNEGHVSFENGNQTQIRHSSKKSHFSPKPEDDSRPFNGTRTFKTESEAEGSLRIAHAAVSVRAQTQEPRTKSRSRSPADLQRPHKRSSSFHSSPLVLSDREKRNKARRYLQADMTSSSDVASPPNARHSSSEHVSLSTQAHMARTDRTGRTPLAQACDKQDEKGVRMILQDSRDDIDIFDFAENRPIQFAALHGSVEIAKMLIEAGCNINVSNAHGDTPLIDAAENGHLELVQMLLDAGANPMIRNKKGQYPEDVASDEHDKQDEIKKLLANAFVKRAEAQPDIEDNEEETIPDKDSWNALMEAKREDFLYLDAKYSKLLDYAGQGDARAVKYLCDSTVPFDNNVVVAATNGGHVRALHALWKYGQYCDVDLDPEPDTVGGKSPILAAIGRGNLGLIRYLVGHPEFDATRKIGGRKVEGGKTVGGKTYDEVSRERKGPRWQTEAQILQNARSKTTMLAAITSGNVALVRSMAEHPGNDSTRRVEGGRTYSKIAEERKDAKGFEMVKLLQNVQTGKNHKQESLGPTQMSERRDSAELPRRRRLITGRQAAEEAARQRSDRSSVSSPSDIDSLSTSLSPSPETQRKMSHDEEAIQKVAMSPPCVTIERITNLSGAARSKLGERVLGEASVISMGLPSADDHCLLSANHSSPQPESARNPGTTTAGNQEGQLRADKMDAEKHRGHENMEEKRAAEQRAEAQAAKERRQAEERQAEERQAEERQAEERQDKAAREAEERRAAEQRLILKAQEDEERRILQLEEERRAAAQRRIEEEEEAAQRRAEEQLRAQQREAEERQAYIASIPRALRRALNPKTFIPAKINRHAQPEMEHHWDLGHWMPIPVLRREQFDPQCGSDRAVRAEQWIMGFFVPIFLRHERLDTCKTLYGWDTLPMTVEQRKWLYSGQRFRHYFAAWFHYEMDWIHAPKDVQEASDVCITRRFDAKEGRELSSVDWRSTPCTESMEKFFDLPGDQCFWVKATDFWAQTEPTNSPHLEDRYIRTKGLTFKDGWTVMKNGVPTEKPEGMSKWWY